MLAQVIFEGATAAPDPASIYSGMQVVIVKTDGTKFSNGDSWKCITCGVPDGNAIGIDDSQYDYPQAFRDGSRLLIEHNVLDCGAHQVMSDDCTLDKMFIYPLRWNVTDGSGATGVIRERRLQSDNVHIEFSSFAFNSSSTGQFAYFTRLSFNHSPSTGVLLTPRYGLVNVTRFYNPNGPRPVTTNGSTIAFNHQAISVGKARGFNGNGTELLHVGSSVESCNTDVSAVNLTTGAVRPVTSHPEYCDPVAFSPDNRWIAIIDTQCSGRNMFIAGMRRILPLVDIVGGILPASTRNNGIRRFFEPHLLDFYGDRGTYFGQKINGGLQGVQGSDAIDDPEWNGMADPRWLPDSTQLVFWQTLAISPACGGANLLPCYTMEQGGCNYRVYIATFTTRKPSPRALVQEHSDTILWGTPYVPGSSDPIKHRVDSGISTLRGQVFGSAEVNITWGMAPTIGTISVVYENYSDDGLSFLNGNECHGEGLTTDELYF